MVHRSISLPVCVLGLVVADASIAMAVLSKPGYKLFLEFLSELGREGLAAQWFNWGMIASGIVLGIFFLTLAIALQSRLAKTGSLLGIVAGIALSCVGIYPIGTALHFPVSAAFFVLAGISGLFLTLSSKMEGEISRKVFWFGIVFLVFDFSFVMFSSSPALETIAVILFEVFALALALGRKP